MKEKLYMNWSSGKDATLALYHLKKSDLFDVDLLFTTISKDNNRVSMHGLHKTLLQAQAAAIGLPLELLELPDSPEMITYNQLMQEKMEKLKQKGYKHTAFGDIFLEDLRAYREKQLAKLAIKAHFPLWKKDTKQLMKEFLAEGFKAIVVSANAKWFDPTVFDQPITQAWVEALPEEVDACGENGEFHTFCFDGPIFKKPIPIKSGKPLKKSYTDPSDNNKTIDFWFGDLQLAE
ncbi:MAG: ATP-binding protein [Vicingaceae bacterium]